MGNSASTKAWVARYVRDEFNPAEKVEFETEFKIRYSSRRAECWRVVISSENQ